MSLNLDILYQYLVKEKITIDKTEFEFQIQSHPNYPSLLSIADTLTFFNINNGAIKVDKTQIDLLPNFYIANLNIESSLPQLFFVEKKETNFAITLDKKTSIITKEEFNQRWVGTVLLIEEEEEVNKKIIKNQKQNWLLPLFATTIFLAILIFYKTNILDILFLIFPFVGVLFSVAALKDLFGAKSKIINHFCNISASTSCETVVNSSKWKFFQIINFSDLSIVFFSAQFISFFLCILSQNVSYFFTIQKIVLLFAIPVIITSLYYQKIVEKKWCPICLVIISIILLEIVYLFTFIKYNSNYFSTNTILLIAFTFLVIFTIWNQLKKLLTNQKKIKENLFKAIRFERNYENFKNNLLTQKQILIPNASIELGNKESNSVITIISNPFCGHCKNAHKIINSIIEKHSETIKVQIIISSDLQEETEINKQFYRSLYQIYLEKGEKNFTNALDFWFEKKNMEEWLKLFKISDVNTMKIDAIYYNHREWLTTNGFNFTPAIFINGYEYPKSYSIETLPYFINEFVEDDF